MKNVLVPVDFSDTSKNAYQFALAYAKKNGATIKLVHIYNSPLNVSNPAVLLSIPEQADRIDTALQKLVGSEMSHVSYESKLGFAVDEIVKYSESGAYDLIIMGTMGEHMSIEKIFGTVSTDVSQRSKCPVMLIPPAIRFSSFDDILFASDYSATKGDVLERIIAFAKTFSSALHFVHVNDKTDNLSISPEEVIFDKVFDLKKSNTPMYFSEVTDSSITDGLNKYINRHQINLLVMVSEKRSFWERFFHRSITKKMVLNTEIPLMVLHIA